MDGLTVGYLAEQNAAKYPDDTALVSLVGGERESVTFAELDDRVNRVANALAARGVSSGTPVAVYMQNNVETVEAYLAAMKLGARPVPVNHRFKGAEVSYVLSDSGASVCVFDAFAAETVEAVRDGGETGIETWLYVGEKPPSFAEGYRTVRDDASAEPVEVVPTRLDEAMLMYTSGTTGTPKGCRLTHDNIIQNSENSVYEAGFGSDERFLVVTPLFHVAAFALFVNTFYTGSATYIMADFEPTRVVDTLEKESITGSFFVPTMSRALLAVDDLDARDLSSFVHYMTGAAPSSEDLKRTIIETFDCDLYDAFGQTEMSPVTTMLLPDDALEKPDSIGKPVINVQLKVVGDDGERVERGEIGRAAYKGPTAFKGYHGLPERTAEVFTDGWFVSGDLVRRDDDGFVYFVGRADDMIVSGGENIYPAEIEDVLFEHPAIDEVAVIGVPDETWGERVKAAVVFEAGESLTDDEIAAYVGERLAGYKKPREIEVYESLPRNPSGKVLRAELTDEE